VADNWRTVTDAAAEAKCERFLADINKILDAGLQPGSSPLADQLGDFVMDAGGELWPVRPSQMSVPDILTFVHRVYGELYVGFCRTFDQLRVH
jgi:hypothetical protein